MRILLEPPPTVGVVLHAARVAHETDLDHTLTTALDAAADEAISALAADVGGRDPQVMRHDHSGHDRRVQPHIHAHVTTDAPQRQQSDAVTLAHSRYQQALALACNEAGLVVRRPDPTPPGWALGPVDTDQYITDRVACTDSSDGEWCPLLLLNPTLAASA